MTDSRRTTHRGSAAALAALVAAIVALLLFVPLPGAAVAAEYGPGFDDADNGGNGRIGAYVVDGRNVYCLEPLRDRPLGATTPAGDADPDDLGVAARDLAAVNWAISTRGQSTDPVVTAAVALYVWSVVAPDDLAAIGGADDGLIARVAAEARDAVRAELAALRADAAELDDPGSVAGSSTGFPESSASAEPLSGELVLSWRDADARHGTLELRSTDAGGVASVELTGAAFVGGTATAELRVGETLAFEGATTDGSSVHGTTTTRATTSGVGTAPGEVATADVVRATGVLRGGATVWLPSLSTFETPGAQLLGGDGGHARAEVELGAVALGAPFAPTVTTAVERATIEPGTPFVDVWVPSAGTRDWPRSADGAFAEVLATGVLYGPFETAPSRSPSPPADAPVAAIVSAALGGGTTDPDGVGVRVSTGDLARPIVATEPGVYVWVVHIHAAEQPDASLLPAGYAWADDFGVPNEITTVLPAAEPTPPPTSNGPAAPTATPDAPAATPDATEDAVPTTTAAPEPTATPTASPTASPTDTTAPPADTTGTPTATAAAPPPAGEVTEPAPPTESTPATEPAPTTGPDGLAETGARGGLDWLLVAGVVVIAGGCLVAAAAIRRADERDDERRADAAMAP